METTETFSPKNIITLMDNPSEKDKELIQKAFDYAKIAHEGQKRKSGEPYFSHVYETAIILADTKSDAVTIAAGLLHDVLEDAKSTEKEIEEIFGQEILSLVQGVTKLGHIKYKGVERHAESLRKFFIASAHDIRVVAIKLADRLHNVSTLEFVPKEKQQRIAIETLDIYARLADRLGMGKMKSQLEDKAFPFAYPEEYEKLKELIKERITFDEQHLKQVAEKLREELTILDAKITSFDYRVKHLYSLWLKLKRFDISKIYDVMALRILVPTITDCYQSIGIIHGLYKHVQGNFKDYIASPKPNGYQSLHTAIFDGSGGIVEVQIRTEQMHEDAEYGNYSHVGYKEVTNGNAKISRSSANWTKELLEMQRTIKNPEDFIKNIKLDFFDEQVFVYTPKGDVIELTKGSTPIDFAYAIHSDIGNHIFGAKINGKMTNIDAVLEQGDIVEILCAEKNKPNRKWLTMCKTNFAKHHIRKYLNEHEGLLAKVFQR